MGQMLSRGNRDLEIDERHLRPMGLHAGTDQVVDLKKLRRLILEGKLAPCYEGLEEDSGNEVYFLAESFCYGDPSCDFFSSAQGEIPRYCVAHAFRRTRSAPYAS